MRTITVEVFRLRLTESLEGHEPRTVDTTGVDVPEDTQVRPKPSLAKCGAKVIELPKRRASR